MSRTCILMPIVLLVTSVVTLSVDAMGENSSFFTDGFYAAPYGAVFYQTGASVTSDKGALGAKVGIEILSLARWRLGLSFTGTGIGSIHYAYYGPSLEIMKLVTNGWQIFGSYHAAKGEMRHTSATKQDPENAWDRYSIRVNDLSLGLGSKVRRGMGFFAALSYRTYSEIDKMIDMPQSQNLGGISIQLGLLFTFFGENLGFGP